MVVRKTLHDSDHALVTLDLKLLHVKDKKSIPPATMTKRLRSEYMAKLVGIELTKNPFTELEVKNEDIGAKWKEVQHIIVDTATKKQNEKLLEPRRPWISERTMELIRKRASIKEQMLTAEDEKLQHNLAKKLDTVRRSIKSAARRDKKDWFTGIIEDIQKAGNVGDSRKVFQGVQKLTGKQGTPPANLDGTKSSIFVDFFTDLLGKVKKPDDFTGEALKTTRAWNICVERLKEERRAKSWEINLEEPSDEEIFAVLRKASRDKSVSGIIPTELWKNCAEARNILAIFIRKVWSGAKSPEEWLNAVLCLLYKQKGKKEDPSSYRGISLLSSAEKVISMIILFRIKPELEKTLEARQAGFTSGKSCRNAVFILLREMEQCLREGNPLVCNFVDFKKAFDSLDWETMWKVMEAQGMPIKIINIIKELYSNATISVRLNMEGKTAEAFQQKVGIRQGCSLSPAIFVLVLDFAMKAYMEACNELGIAQDAEWSGYADDLAIRSKGVENAERAFHQLQAACAFVGLECNIGKTASHGGLQAREGGT